MKNTGGPAFPLIYDVPQKEERHIYSGMTLRDYFAAKALTTMFVDLDCDKVAGFAYTMADAMLKAREE